MRGATYPTQRAYIRFIYRRNTCASPLVVLFRVVVRAWINIDRLEERVSLVRGGAKFRRDFFFFLIKIPLAKDVRRGKRGGEVGGHSKMSVGGVWQHRLMTFFEGNYRGETGVSRRISPKEQGANAIVIARDPCKRCFPLRAFLHDRKHYPVPPESEVGRANLRASQRLPEPCSTEFRSEPDGLTSTC